MTGIGFALVNELLIIAFFTAAVYVLIRHVLTDYVYNVTDDGYLQVVKITSGIPKTLASVKMSRNDIVVKVEKNMKKKHPDVVKTARYDLTLFSAKNSWYIFESEGKKYALVLEGDEPFFDYLRERISRLDG